MKEPDGEIKTILSYINRDIGEIKGDIKEMKDKYVTKDELEAKIVPLKSEVNLLKGGYGLVVGAVTLALIAAFMKLVLKI